MSTHAQPTPHTTHAPARLARPQVLRVVHSIRHADGPRTFTPRYARVPKEFFNHQLTAWERDYLNWYHGDPLKRSFSKAHQHSMNHRTEVLESHRCGCFHCGATFAPGAIKEWMADSKEATAFCPHCDVDAVLGDASGYPITAEFLDAMRRCWF